MQARRQLHAVPLVVQVVGDHGCDLWQAGGKFAPVRVFYDLFEGDILLHSGDAAFVLTGACKGHLQPTRLRVEAENEIVLAWLGLKLGGEEDAEGLPPVRARAGQIGLLLVAGEALEHLEGRGPYVATYTGE